MAKADGCMQARKAAAVTVSAELSPEVSQKAYEAVNDRYMACLQE